MNEYQRIAYQRRNRDNIYKSAMQRYSENCNDDIIDIYIKEHKYILDIMEKNENEVMTDKQLDAVVKKLLDKIL